MVRRIASFWSRWDLSFRTYFLAAIGNPGLFLQALRRASDRNARVVRAAARGNAIAVAEDPRPTEAKSADELLKGLSKRFHVLEIDRRPGHVTVGIADLDFLAAVLTVLQQAPGAAVLLGDTPLVRSAPGFKEAILRAPAVDLRFTGPDLEPMRLSLESFRLTEPGKWLSNNNANRVMKASYGESFAAPGHSRALDVLGAPTLQMLAVARPVDAVYTWVNHDDPQWREMYLAAKRKDGPAESKGTGDAAAISRFHNNDELRYSLRSLALHAPWLRRIFVFSNCARPGWLRPDHPRLTWVRHEEVIPAEFLPTFNSHVIESFLHRIPGLADQFIYLNDDFFLLLGVSKEDFFSENGLSYARLESYGMVSGEVREGDPDYLNAARNSARLIRELHGFSATQLHRHVPYALRRPILEEIEDRFAGPINAFRVNRFRRINDINIPSFLYHHYALGTARGVTDVRESILVKSNDLRWRQRLDQAADRKGERGYFLCLNEGGTATPPAAWHDATRLFLEDAFGAAAEWEVG